MRRSSSEEPATRWRQHNSNASTAIPAAMLLIFDTTTTPNHTEEKHREKHTEEHIQCCVIPTVAIALVLCTATAVLITYHVVICIHAAAAHSLAGDKRPV